MIGKMLDRIGPRGFMALFEQFAATGDLPLADVRTPTLVLSGGKNRDRVDARAGALAGSMPAATVELVDHYDHFCHVEQAEDVARRVAEFVHAVLPDRRAG
jgi:pimeloyl-ACP methyl ester carboxylesterase